MKDVMMGAVLPGNSTAELREFPVPQPAHGEVLVRVGASTICGSDIRCIYREHLGKGPEGYQPGMIAGHEPAGQIVAAGPGLRRFGVGDRVIVYHISGCGLCNDCRRGFMISCTSPWRRAYGWQRDGGMAEYLLAEEKDLIGLPDGLDYVDGAQVACGFGTVYEAIAKIGVLGADAVLVTGLGPVGLAAAMLARAMGARQVIGTDVSPERRTLALSMGLVDEALDAAGGDVVGEVRRLTRGHGCEKAIECSANDAARRVAIQATRQWGDVALVGEGGTCTFAPSPDLIHEQKRIHGSWVTSIWRMEELVERLERWGIHPAELVTHRFALADVGDAYRLMAEGRCGKVAVTFEGGSA